MQFNQMVCTWLDFFDFMQVEYLKLQDFSIPTQIIHPLQTWNFVKFIPRR